MSDEGFEATGFSAEYVVADNGKLFTNTNDFCKNQMRTKLRFIGDLYNHLKIQVENVHSFPAWAI